MNTTTDTESALSMSQAIDIQFTLMGERLEIKPLSPAGESWLGANVKLLVERGLPQMVEALIQTDLRLSANGDFSDFVRLNLP